jgi:hypothetical protein
VCDRHRLRGAPGLAQDDRAADRPDQLAVAPAADRLERPEQRHQAVDVATRPEHQRRQGEHVLPEHIVAPLAHDRDPLERLIPAPEREQHLDALREQPALGAAIPPFVHERETAVQQRFRLLEPRR